MIGVGTIIHEIMYQMLAQVLILNIQLSSSFKPAILRQVLETGLSLFPSNTLLLSLYGWSEGRNRLDARMRSFLSTHLAKYSNT